MESGRLSIHVMIVRSVQMSVLNCSYLPHVYCTATTFQLLFSDMSSTTCILSCDHFSAARAHLVQHCRLCLQASPHYVIYPWRFWLPPEEGFQSALVNHSLGLPLGASPLCKLDLTSAHGKPGMMLCPSVFRMTTCCVDPLAPGFCLHQPNTFGGLGSIMT
jgi:hypothetical protein